MKALALLTVSILISLGSFAQQKQVKSKSFGTFTIVADSFNAELGLWYKIRLVVNKASYPIKGLAAENGSEFDIRPSADKRFFVIDNIIKGYEEMDGKKELHENYKCVVVDVQKRRVVYEMQSECGGKWNKSKWVDGGTVVFDPMRK